MNKVILFYGLPASGKYTMAKRLASATNAHLIDNHYFMDFVKPFIGKHGGVSSFNESMKKIISEFYNIVGEFYPKDRQVTYIATFCIINPKTDYEVLEDLKKLAKSISGEFIPIGLLPNFDALKIRCATEERKDRGKLHCPVVYENNFYWGDPRTAKPLAFEHKNKFEIDTSDLTEDETYAKIKQYLAKFN